MQAGKNKILIVDDEPDIVDSLKHFLSAKGYEVSGALSAEEALRMLEKEKADLILLDIMLPGIQGSEVARIIKEKYPEIKIIVVTGYPNEIEDLSKGNLLEGAFIKPIRIQELYNKLVEVFNRDDTLDIDLKSKKGISAMVLLIKARLLFVEPSDEIYNFLNVHFKGFSSKGENYEQDVVGNKENLEEKIMLFKPDILVVNATSLKGTSMSLSSEISAHGLSLKEIILYNIGDLQTLHQTELERLKKSIEIVCLRNGLIEIRCIEI